MRTLSICLAMVVLCAVSAKAGTLGTTVASFAVLGASTVTNTGATTITGNVGVYAGTSIIGESTITLLGTSAYEQTNGVAQTAQGQLNTAITNLGNLTPTESLTGEDLGTVSTLTAGVYTFSTSAELTGALTLNAQGLSNQTFVFLIGSTLTTASDSIVTITNPGANDAVYWVVGSSATLGTDTAFEGNILAVDSITVNTGATDSCGRLLASTGAVTLDNNTISIGCGTVTGESDSGGLNGGGGAGPVATPEPTPLSLLALGFSGIGFLRSKRRRVGSRKMA
jgi:type VI secretion system secreted protein VgrG